MSASQVRLVSVKLQSRVLTATSKDCRIRLYDMNTSRQVKVIRARDVGWSVIDTAYSPDQRWIIYSSWWFDFCQSKIFDLRLPKAHINLLAIIYTCAICAAKRRCTSRSLCAPRRSVSVCSRLTLLLIRALSSVAPQTAAFISTT